MPITALELLDDRQSTAMNAARRTRDKRKEDGARPTFMEGYREGEAAAYLDARRLMAKELHRLANRFQNGQLTLSDFGINL